MMRRTRKAFVQVILGVVFVGSCAFAQTFRSVDVGIEHRIDSLLRLMTLEEKLGQLNQVTPKWSPNTKETTSAEQREMIRRGRIGSFLGLVGAEETRKAQRVAVEESRLKIPLIFGFDVIHGYRTTFPIPLAMAGTWNPELIEQAARVAAIEASAAGIHWTFAPMVDIARDPRWGRIAEGAGEDPYLGSMMAGAQVRGFQGTDLRQVNTLLACAKHFAAYGAAEAGRDYNIADMSERTLREIYLPPFKAAVDAGVGTLMSSFNEINGVPSSANRWLMTDVLRGEWKFNGFVVSDWTAIEELQKHGVATSREHAGILALDAGVDMDMMDSIYVNELPQAVREKRIPERVVNESVRRVLRAKLRLGLFENPYRNCDTTMEKEVMLAPEHFQLSRKVAQESIVLLKNEKSILPLEKDMKTIAVLGPLANDRYNPLGAWYAKGNRENVVSVLEGIKKKVSAQTRLLYAKGCEIESDSGFNRKEAVTLARKADVAIVVVGESLEMSGEAASRSSLDLPGKQKELIKAIYETGKPVVLVLMNGRPLTISWEADHVPAILESWFLGVESGNAIADVLFGDVNPSGKLPVSFPRNVGQIPIYYNHKTTGRPVADNKYTSKYLDVASTPLYPFGYGLSYTTFSYSNLRISSPTISPHQELKVLVDVANTGRRSGDEIVQLYVQDEVASVTRPVKELKGFQRVSLNAGEKKTVEFMLKPEHLAFWNQVYDLVEEMKFVVEPGMFKVFVGTNSGDVLEARFEVVAN